jgi:hypothetical protein
LGSEVGWGLGCVVGLGVVLLPFALDPELELPELLPVELFDLFWLEFLVFELALGGGVAGVAGLGLVLLPEFVACGVTAVGVGPELLETLW